MKSIDVIRMQLKRDSKPGQPIFVPDYLHHFCAYVDTLEVEISSLRSRLFALENKGATE